ncbi:AraC family transcriptional regulator [Massilia sp. MB5]|uniref:AraC family transcriptional regulator n=1 Tax=Massilia sp. MB5 TaxID=2919578 RepID=UPI001F118470|nr:GyrI-like domain-containing protein [Massilia sp. MB5]UMR30293.1 AraC family transcriptional regulator [Massilia sp. MB5]
MAENLPQLNRAEYARRMNRVIDHIDRHLDSALETAELADIANFSRFHFHRIFAAWMGETIGDYVRRRRLETAAFHLSCGTQASVLEVALATGFGSGEALARAFRQKFGCSPSAWRDGTRERLAALAAGLRQAREAANSNPDQVNGNDGQAGFLPLGEHGDSQSSNGESQMEVRVIDLPAVTIAYQRHIGPYGMSIGEFWRSTMSPWMHSHGLDSATCYGVGHDDPSITAPEKCRYDACVEVPEGFKNGGQASISTLPGGRYAVAQFEGPPTAIAGAWNSFISEWLPSSGLQCDERPLFERFSPQTALNPQTGEFSCELCIPVRAL